MNFIEETQCKLSVNNGSFNTLNTYKLKASATSGVREGGAGVRPPGLKNSGQTLFSEQAQVSQKSWKIKNFSMQWKIPGHILFFRASAGCSKLWRIKNTFNTVNSGHTLFFRASSSCSKILKDKKYFNTVKIFWPNSVFQGKRRLFKILNDKK